ncbi:ATPase [Allosphingosinicella flava]|uniref:ATPase n=1 Tax=Allosphingosinicella flava TaxID=2771430 RepID=A0A7T2GJ82_9SPHN|nr:ATP12 family protein [Sphingosinicella flava]QPQ54860.1 ATPase [Sphingosinicella flava]
MKRFYQAVAVRAGPEGHEILLDGRPVRTPAREPLLLPTAALAEAVAAEWEGQGDRVDPRTMPLTGLANAAIDRVAKERMAFADGLARYGESDLLCYRADGPDSLAARQEGAWAPLLDWARRRFDVDFTLVCGVMHSAQPAGTVERLGAAVGSRSAFELAGLSPLVTISGSLVIALALAEGAVDLDTAWTAASLDEAWQAEQWGADAEAQAALEARRRDFEAAHRFLSLL